MARIGLDLLATIVVWMVRRIRRRRQPPGRHERPDHHAKD